MPPAVLLLSGGLDSTTMLAYAVDKGFDVHAHDLSLRPAPRRRDRRGATGRARRIACATTSSSTSISAPSAARPSPPTSTSPRIASTPISPTGIPITYVPARNTIFLSFCLAWSEVLGASDIFIGVNALDYSGYPDCRPEYVAAFQRMANLATKGGVEGTLPVRIQTPLLHLTKRQIVELGLSLGVDYALTLSCYDPSADGRACGHCDSCQLRRRGFAEAGVADPTRYVGVD